MSASLPTFAVIAIAPISFAFSVATVLLISERITFAPSFANRLQNAKPMPLAPPVTIITLCLKFSIVRIFVFVCKNSFLIYIRINLIKM
jgi:hypothetical protein